MIPGMVSIVIPCFNAEKWIAQTLSSALDQSYDNVEIIVIDDGSTDSSVSVVTEKSDKIKILFHEDRKNYGQSSAINLGIKYAQGEFVAFLDSDDLWERDKLLKQVAYLQQNPDVALVYTNGQAIDAENVAQYSLFEANHHESNEAGDLLLNCYIRTPSTVMMRIEAIYETGTFDTSLQSCDHDYWLRVTERFKIAYLADQLTSYRRHPTQLSGNRRQWEDGMIILKKASKRYPYTRKYLRKRMAVICYRLGKFDIAVKGKRLIGLKNLFVAFLLDSRRALKTIFN